MSWKISTPALTEAKSNSQSDEVRKRAGDLLGELKKTIRPAKKLRAMRAVETLEWIATKAAEKQLATWATGDPGARLTQNAVAALPRVKAGNRTE